ncbi:MAG: LLM class flavin-dependent oxidoreductase, partial [Dehalococcoidia bacterium]
MSVRIGLALGGWPFQTRDSAPFWDLVDQAEALGYDSLWLSDRLISGSPVIEPITGLAAIAGRTRRLKFG